MLVEIRIENFAIIDRLDLKFGPGLTTLTGETGAGKSILIDAVEMVLGGRADTAMVRSGADRAIVEGEFKLDKTIHAELLELLNREALLDDTEYIILGREIRAADRNIARVNGHSVSVSLLREIGDFLVDVHGQSEHLSLLKVNEHLKLLDRYSFTNSKFSVAEVYQSYSNNYSTLQNVESNIQEVLRSRQDAVRRTDILEYQLNEIATAHLVPDEEGGLLEERNRLANAEALARLVQESLTLLDGETPEKSNIIDLLGKVVTSLSGLVKLDSSQSQLQQNALSSFEELNDLVKNLTSYLETIQFNPSRLNQLEERLSLIENLKRKYGESIREVLDFAVAARNELESISHSEERLAILENEKEQLLKKLSVDGEVLAEKRRCAGEQLSRLMEAELEELNMSGARFKVSYVQQEDPDGLQLSDGRRVTYGLQGLDRIEFLIAPNPGEGFKPLVKIASGGETSRLMLALKNVLTRVDQIPTLIFDEIDQGIGGRIGIVVGEKLWRLAKFHQVFCITHLPQLAAFGNHHYAVKKHIVDGRTTTRVLSLEGETRITELAEMMGDVSDGTLHTARELDVLVKKKMTDD